MRGGFWMVLAGLENSLIGGRVRDADVDVYSASFRVV
jgi:hypothetical protein